MLKRIKQRSMQIVLSVVMNVLEKESALPGSIGRCEGHDSTSAKLQVGKGGLKKGQEHEAGARIKSRKYWFSCPCVLLLLLSSSHPSQPAI